FLLLGGRLERRRSRLDIGLGELPGREAEPGHTEPFGDLPSLLPELERPDRVGRVDVHGAVLRDARRPGVPRDRLAHRSGPTLEELRHAGLGAEARELVADVLTERFQVPPPPPVRARAEAPTHGSR